MQLKKSSPNWQIEKVLYSIMTMQGHTHLWSFGKNYWSLVRMFCHIHHIVLTLHHLITFCFDLYKTPWMIKISIMMMISNRTWFSFLLIKTRSFMNMGLWCWKMAKGHWSKWATHYGIKLFSSMKKLSLIF